MEQAHPEPFLHPRHCLADCRRRDAELPSRNVKLRASTARTKAFSDPGCPSADPPLRTIESNMFGATAHCSSFGSLYLYPTSTHSSSSDRRQLHTSPATP